MGMSDTEVYLFSHEFSKFSNIRNMSSAVSMCEASVDFIRFTKDNFTLDMNVQKLVNISLQALTLLQVKSTMLEIDSSWCSDKSLVLRGMIFESKI
jgi:hypothetical protein